MSNDFQVFQILHKSFSESNKRKKFKNDRNIFYIARDCKAITILPPTQKCI